MDITLYRITHRAPAILVALAIAGLTACSTPQPKPELSEPVVQQQSEPAPVVVEIEAEPLQLRPDYPERYTVEKGDTLWDISARFLRDPWRWPELWQSNPQVNNPHLIYPGDILSLYFVDGRPVMGMERRGSKGMTSTSANYPTVKLDPKVRVEDLDAAIATIPLHAINQFLVKPQVITKDELAEAPYIIGTPDDRLLAATGSKIYVRGITNNHNSSYLVVRPGREFKNKAGEVLGYEAEYLADAALLTAGDPATLRIVKSSREVFKGDNLLVGQDVAFLQNFHPRPPESKVDGQIIAVVDGVARVGQFQVVVLDLGRQEGIERGHTLAVKQTGKMVNDSYAQEEVQLPAERSGLAMVFRVFDRVSYAIIMQADRSIHRWDLVTTP